MAGNFHCFQASHSHKEPVIDTVPVQGQNDENREGKGTSGNLGGSPRCPRWVSPWSPFPGAGLQHAPHLLCSCSSVIHLCDLDGKHSRQLHPNSHFFGFTIPAVPSVAGYSPEFPPSKAKERSFQKEGDAETRKEQRLFLFSPEIVVVWGVFPLQQGLPSPTGSRHTHSFVSKPLLGGSSAVLTLVCARSQPAILEQLLFFRSCKELARSIVINEIKATALKSCRVSVYTFPLI